ncbi:hypothetical protein ACQZ4O_05145 [Agrobacterium vitis]|uniref:hypothetical protein n=1 Tax=Rhizobium/Agrobacterium group TaxID=227290 RepID=UPI0018D1F784|nr:MULTISPECIES: hypothetical protein [Rhizobium/Agrobacterium group]
MGISKKCRYDIDGKNAPEAVIGRGLEELRPKLRDRYLRFYSMGGIAFKVIGGII